MQSDDIIMRDTVSQQRVDRCITDSGYRYYRDEEVPSDTDSLLIIVKQLAFELVRVTGKPVQIGSNIIEPCEWSPIKPDVHREIEYQGINDDIKSRHPWIREINFRLEQNQVGDEKLTITTDHSEENMKKFMSNNGRVPEDKQFKAMQEVFPRVSTQYSIRSPQIKRKY